jgi:putative CRISPR-associated protein (TIGR02619 family)
MSRTIITTCGTSLFQSSCWSYNGLNENQLSKIEDEQDRREHESRCEINLMEAMRLKKESEVSNSFDKSSWEDPERLRDMPAEFASLRAIQICFENEKINKPFSKDDNVILLHSNNEDGKFCADVLYTILNNEKFNLLPEVKIDKWQVMGLDPQDSSEFGNALMSIWRQIIEKSLKEDRKYIFNLTGGYKGVSILLGGIAYYLSKVDIFYLHENTIFEEISIMGFNKSEEKENRFYTGSFNIKKRKFVSSPPGGCSPLP